MSDRSLLLPERAMQGMLTNFLQRLRAAESDTRFPGAVRFGELLGPTSLTLGYAVNNLVSIALDPGRWTVMAGTIIAAGGPVTLANWDFQLALSSPSVVYPAVRTGYEAQSLAPPFYASMFLPYTLKLSAAETITARAYCFTSGAGTASASGSYLIAVPT